MQDGSVGKIVCTVQPRGHMHVAVDVARSVLLASVTGAMCQMLDGEIDAALDALVLEEVG